MNRGRFAALCLMLCAGLGPAQAASFSVSPVRLELAPGQASTSLKVSNEGDEAKLLQVSIVGWTRQNGEDRYGPNDPDTGLIVTPPLFQVSPAGGSQLVRIGFLRPPVAGLTERAWRVIVEEVPKSVAANPADTATAGAGSIKMRLRINLPLFLAPASPHQDLRWEGQADTAGELRLVAINAGNVSERIDELLLKSADQKTQFGRLPGPIYIFPGEHRVLKVRASTAPRAGTVKLVMQGTLRPLVSDLVLRAQ
jgi:P pilus assembly chaperone PapD